MTYRASLAFFVICTFIFIGSSFVWADRGVSTQGYKRLLENKVCSGSGPGTEQCGLAYGNITERECGYQLVNTCEQVKDWANEDAKSRAESEAPENCKEKFKDCFFSAFRVYDITRQECFDEDPFICARVNSRYEAKCVEEKE